MWRITVPGGGRGLIVSLQTCKCSHTRLARYLARYLGIPLGSMQESMIGSDSEGECRMPFLPHDTTLDLK